VRTRSTQPSHRHATAVAPWPGAAIFDNHVGDLGHGHDLMLGEKIKESTRSYGTLKPDDM